MIVVKVGGSLFDHPALGPVLREFVASLAPAEVLLVPGGGPVADAVRQLDTVHGLGEEAAHWLALRSLGVTADLLGRLLVSGGALAPTGPQVIAQGISPGLAGANTRSPEGATHAHVCAAPSGLPLSFPSATQGFRPGLLPNAPSGRKQGDTNSPLTVLDPFTFAQEDESRSGALPHTWSVTTDSIAARAAVVYRAERLILLKSVDIPPETSWGTAAASGWVDAHFPQIAATLTCPVEVVNFRRKLPSHA